jgi:hypothetical protein
MDVNDDAYCLRERFFASNLRQRKRRRSECTRCLDIHRWQASSHRGIGYIRESQVGCQAASRAFDLAFDLLAPSRGRVEVLRSGQTGMDAGLAAPGHGWPMAAGPRSRTGARACRATARHRTTGARALGYLGLFQVTRCKSETASRRYRRNGYVLSQQKIGRLSGRLREQARSYNGIRDIAVREWLTN